MTSTGTEGQGAQQETIDALNATFWDELCGTTLARHAGITDDSPESLRRFDAEYLRFYPYLERYLPTASRAGSALEIGLGYGTVSQLLAERFRDYRGLDIAAGPVSMVRHRLAMLGVEDTTVRVLQGSALAIPHADEMFDFVCTIGCLHHTGDLPRAVAELRRVLRPGGELLVMLYNSHSLRQVSMRVRETARRRPGTEARARARYDLNSAGEAAPTTEFVSVRQARRLFGFCRELRIEKQNFDGYAFRVRGLPAVRLPRERLLSTAGRLAGLDLYISGRR